MAQEEYFDDEAAKLREARKLRREARREANAYWDQVLGTYAGRFVINDILENMAQFFAGSFAGEQTHMTAFKEGHRNVGAQIMEQGFTRDQNLFTLMRSEFTQRVEATKNKKKGKPDENTD